MCGSCADVAKLADTKSPIDVNKTGTTPPWRDGWTGVQALDHAHIPQYIHTLKTRYLHTYKQKHILSSLSCSDGLLDFFVNLCL